MGFLSEGETIKWNDLKAEQLRHVKTHGVEQFIHLWQLNKNRNDEDLKWGDEVEYTLLFMDAPSQRVHLWSYAAVIQDELLVRENLRVHFDGVLASDWRPEMGAHMIEALPDPPYKLSMESLVSLEESMKLRRQKIQAILPEDVYVSSQTNFPLMGMPRFMMPFTNADPQGSCSRSSFIPDRFINPHPRFSTLVNNVRCRRGAKVAILVPVYEDVNTLASPIWEHSLDTQDRFVIEKQSGVTPNPVKGMIYMDMFGFGMGMSCVQLTYATANIGAARYLYDQLGVLAPLWLALTASTPFFRGLVAATDTRWSALSQSVDCRTQAESESIPKSRYSGLSLYISDDPVFVQRQDEYNDTNVPIAKDAYDRLVEAGVDSVLAGHYGHLWMRDPLVIYDGKIAIDDKKFSDHFENIQSTNWNSVRFKPPPSYDSGPSPIGWRVEFRTPEAQCTDFENAACAAIASLITQCITEKKWDLYIPMSKNDENIERASTPRAASEQYFWFRRNIMYNTPDREVVEMTLNEILFGCATHKFEGLITLAIPSLVDGMGADEQAIEKVMEYIRFVRMRVSGQLLTNATFFRELVCRHPAYNQDSIITDEIGYLITRAATALGLGDLQLIEDLECVPLVRQMYGPYFGKVFTADGPLTHDTIGVAPWMCKAADAFSDASSMLQDDRPSESQIETKAAPITVFSHGSSPPLISTSSDDSHRARILEELAAQDGTQFGASKCPWRGELHCPESEIGTRTPISQTGTGAGSCLSPSETCAPGGVTSEDASLFWILCCDKIRGCGSATSSAAECSTMCPTASMCDGDVGEQLTGQLPGHNRLCFDGSDDFMYFRMVWEGSA